MNNKEYDKLVKKTIGKENVFSNVLIAFITGGIIGTISEYITNMYMQYFSINLNDAYLLTFMTLILFSSILTGLGFFDKVLSICKCGLIVPSTGFANSMTSAAMDYKKEGFVKGIGSSMFKLTGSIILYGIIFGIIFGFVRSMIL